MSRARYVIGPPEIRYEAKIDRSGGPDACHPWTASTTSCGYGQMNVEGRKVEVHRWAYLRFVGPLGPGEVVRHTCDNPPCQNARHWLKGTYADNMRDMVQRGRHPAARQTRCSKGHHLDEVNTYREPAHPTRRRCRACNAAACRRYYPKRRLRR